MFSFLLISYRTTTHPYTKRTRWCITRHILPYLFLEMLEKIFPCIRKGVSVIKLYKILNLFFFSLYLCAWKLFYMTRLHLCVAICYPKIFGVYVCVCIWKRGKFILILSNCLFICVYVTKMSSMWCQIILHEHEMISNNVNLNIHQNFLVQNF